MNHRLAQLRSPVTLLTCLALLCAALAGVLTFAGRASAAPTNLGPFTLAPASGTIASDPVATSATSSAGCPAASSTGIPNTAYLRVYKPNANPDAVTSQQIIGQGTFPDGTAPFTVDLEPAPAPQSLEKALRKFIPTGSLDGTYQLSLACRSGLSTPRFFAKIRVTDDTWTLLQQQTTNLTLTAATDVPVNGDLKLTATVTPEVATGTVEFKKGDESLGTADVTGGKAELTVKAPAVGGPHAYQAVFKSRDPDAYSDAQGSVTARIGYLLTAKDAEGNTLGDKPTLSIGQSVKITVQGFTPGSTVKVNQSNASGVTFPDATPNAEGTIVDYAFTVPDRTINGETDLYFDEGGSPNNRATFDFISTDEEPSPDPTTPADLEVTDEDGTPLDANPNLEPGQTVKITARGYTKDATVKVTLAESEETFEDAKANAEGTVEAYEFTVPEDIADGDHTLTLAEDKQDGHSVDFAFTTGEEPSGSPSPSTSETSGDDAGTDNGGTDNGGTDSGGGVAGGDTGGTGTGTGSMASTGAQVGAIGLTALALLCAGSALVLHMRRKGLLSFGGDTPQHH
ncbi:Ig-like domain repeat protein [Streptomyces spinoverrucosus]|uniref:Ig-like domain repeat protein n=1 Tax=Streptomyces spinoverrucosus TaxID=284043 RepID=UPI0011444C46|nr:Ig-like domain repeat protein [Streptomyces spinoverrucosus]